MGHLRYVYGMAMAGLFVLAVIVFASTWASDNSTTIDISQDPEVSRLKSGIESNLTSLNTADNNSLSLFKRSTLQQGDQATAGGGQFKTGITQQLGLVFNSLYLGYNKIFGSPEKSGLGQSSFYIFLATLLGLISYTAAALGYKAWIGRNPE